MIDLQVQANFPRLAAFSRNLQDAMIVGVQAAAVEVELIAISEVLLYEAYDTYALMESIYVSVYGYSTYEEKADMAADAALNNPTNWPDIRQTKIFNGDDPYLVLDPKVESQSRYDAWVAVAAAHGKYVENGYLSWYNNWVPARPFWQATADRARPEVLRILSEALNQAQYGRATALPTIP